jgi:nicotinate phosphoribosyltransferase
LPADDPTAGTPALLVDLYELTMAESYVREGIADRPATFELFCRTLPRGWGYLLAAGIDDTLDLLEELRFDEAELTYLRSTGLFGDELLERLAGLRFTGEVRAMREGTVFFAGEPVLEIAAPLLEAQLVETAVLGHVHHQSLIAGKAARCVDAAQGRTLSEFGLRRSHGGEAGIRVARSSYLAGFDSTSDVLAGQRYGIPVAGTMAHSYVACFEDETAAFEAFTRAYPRGATLLIDTYDTLRGAERAAEVGRALAAHAGRLGGVRIDSGDLLELSAVVRRTLDEAGLAEARIFASGNLDEHEIAHLVAAAAPIDGFGVGSRLAVSADAPYLDAVYKLVAYNGKPVLKLSPGKETLPGSKQVWRRLEHGRFAGDVVGLPGSDAPAGAEPLLEPMLAGGGRLVRGGLPEARERAAAQRAALPSAHRALDAEPYPVEVGAALAALRDEVAGGLALR